MEILVHKDTETFSIQTTLFKNSLRMNTIKVRGKRYCITDSLTIRQQGHAVFYQIINKRIQKQRLELGKPFIRSTVFIFYDCFFVDVS